MDGTPHLVPLSSLDSDCLRLYSARGTYVMCVCCSHAYYTYRTFVYAYDVDRQDCQQHEESTNLKIQVTFINCSRVATKGSNKVFSNLLFRCSV
jgi:hypothetical protein